MKKILIILAMILMMMPFAASVQELDVVIQSETGITISTNIAPAISQNITRSWEIHLINTSNQIIEDATCLLHIYDENGAGGHLYRKVSSTFDEYGDMEFIVNASVHDTKGVYSSKVICNTSGQAGLYERTYYVTKSGKEPAGDSFRIFIYLFFILTFLGLFYSFFITLANFATFEESIYDVLIAWFSVISLFIVIHLGEEYLISTFVESLASWLIDLTIYTNGVLPLLAFIISMIFKGIKKKQPPKVYDILGRRLV